MKFNDQELQQLEQLLSDALAPINLQLHNGEKRMDGLALNVAELSLKQETNNVRTEQMYKTFDTAQKGLVLLGSIGSGMKWAAGIVLAVAAAWTTWKGGKS